MFSFIWWLIIGLVAGALARLLMPGKQPMGLLLTMVLGLVGSVIGGFIASLIFGYDPLEPGFHAGGLVMSTLGALLVLGVYLGVTRRSSTPRI
jgi:uncharacterized membrane protein YeaQ/YmgE (transglycosylase-associated protein family)